MASSRDVLAYCLLRDSLVKTKTHYVCIQCKCVYGGGEWESLSACQCSVNPCRSPCIIYVHDKGVSTSAC